jgi:hypothetical protein
VFSALAFFIGDCIPLTTTEPLAADGMAVNLDHRVVTAFASLTPLEMDRYQSHKCQLIVHAFELLILLLDKYTAFALSLPSLFERPLFALLFQVMLQPESMGFSDTRNSNNQQQQQQQQQNTTRSNLLATASTLARLLVSKLPADDVHVVHQTLQSILASEASNLFHIDLNDAGINLPRSLALVEGYSKLHEINLLLHNLPPEAANLSTDMAQSVFDTHHRYTPTQLLLASSVLQLCFATGLAPHSLVGYLLDENAATGRSSASTAAATSGAAGGRVGGAAGDEDNIDLEIELELDEEASSAASMAARAKAASGVPTNLSVTQATRGSLFYEDFSLPIVSHILSNFSDFAAHIMSNIRHSTVMFRLLLDCADVHIRARAGAVPQQRVALAHEFLDEICAHSDKVAAWTAIDSQSREKENMLEFLKRLLKVDATYLLGTRERAAWVCESFIALLARGIPLSLKNEVLELLAPIFEHLPATMAPLRQSIKTALVNVTGMYHQILLDSIRFGSIRFDSIRFDSLGLIGIGV